MKNKIISVLMCTLFWWMFFSGNVSEVPAKAEYTSHISSLDGSFIQPWLYATWDDARWRSEMQILKETGIDTLVMGDTANQNNDDSWTVYYPSELDFLKGYYAYDAVGTILHYCHMYDIKLYLGMGLDTNWNSDLTVGEGLEANREYMRKCNMITTELYTKYKSQYPDTYYGFYFVTEIYNTYYMETDYGSELYTDGLREMFNTVLDNCSTLDPNMPLLFSPYVNIFGYGYASINTDRFTEFWTQALTKINFRDGDMICPQDSCGAGGNDIVHLEEWTAAYRNAVDRSNQLRGTHLLLGTNAEMFIQPDSVRMAQTHGVDYTGTKTIDDFTKRLEIAAPYVDKLFCFAYTHHYSPNNAQPGFHKAFIKYLHDGTIEKNPPLPPDTICTEVVDTEGADHLKLSFSGMDDDTEAGQINIYKNGVFYDYLTAGVNNGRTDCNHVKNTWTDYNFNISTDTAVYEFETVDVCGNVSEKRSYTVTPQNVNNGVDIYNHNENMGAAKEWKRKDLDYLSYMVTDSGVRITDCDPAAVSIVIPDYIEGKPVTVIDWYAFENCSRLESIIVPKTVTHISRFAFAHCISLTYINLPSSLYAIEQYAFFDCMKLTGINLPGGLAIIESRAFSGCRELKDIKIPDSCKELGDYAFFNCAALENISFASADTQTGKRCIGYMYDSGYITVDQLIVDVEKGGAVAEYCNNNNVRISSDILMGDVDINGIIDVRDAVMLIKWFIGSGEITDRRAGDIDKNGVISIIDICLLKSKLLVK